MSIVLTLLSLAPCPQQGATAPPQSPVAEAEALLTSGDAEGALARFRAASQNPRFAAPASVGAARAAARLGRTDGAFQWLGQAVRSGWGNRAQLRDDADLKTLAEDERYAKVLPPLLEDDDAFAEDVRVIHTWVGETAGEQYGWVTRRVGDLDGDGVCDFASTGPSANGYRGMAHVVSSKTGKELLRVDGETPGQQLGNSVAGEVDVDGDGVHDVLVGGPGFGQVPGVALVVSGKTGKTIHSLSEGNAGDQYGMKLAGLEDLDGDGHAEVCIGAPGLGAGKAVVVSGKTGEKLFDIAGENAGDRFGTSIDGTKKGGHHLVAVGAPAAGETNKGRVYLFDLTKEGAKRRAVYDADETGGQLGLYFVTFFGDVDGDDVPDLYATDFTNSATGPGTGRAYVWSAATGKELYTITGHAPGEGFGTTAAACGDANGDGAADLIIGAWQHGGVAPSAGACYLHSGKDGSLLHTWRCAQAQDTLGFDAIGVGDADGDGNDDFVMSSAWSIVDYGRQGRVFLVAGPKLK